MKVRKTTLPVIVEKPPSYSPSSQNARIEGSFHRSEIVQNHLHAQRLQARMAVETKKPSVLESARTVAYKAALASGALALATIACAFFITNGWAIPVGFAVLCVLLFVAAGKRTQEIERTSEQMRNNQQECPV
jgi:hypothetical protein